MEILAECSAGRELSIQGGSVWLRQGFRLFLNAQQCRGQCWRGDSPAEPPFAPWGCSTSLLCRAQRAGSCSSLKMEIMEGSRAGWAVTVPFSYSPELLTQDPFAAISHIPPAGFNPKNANFLEEQERGAGGPQKTPKPCLC